MKKINGGLVCFVFLVVWNDYSISFVCVRNMKEKRKREKIGENFISDISFYKKMPPANNNHIKRSTGGAE